MLRGVSLIIPATCLLTLLVVGPNLTTLTCGCLVMELWIVGLFIYGYWYYRSKYAALDMEGVLQNHES